MSNDENEFNPIQAYRIVREWAKANMFDDLWFENFIRLFEYGWTKKFTWLGDTYEFECLYDFIKDRNGLNADPLAIYLAVQSCADSKKFQYADRLLILFNENGMREQLGFRDAMDVNKSGRKPQIDKEKVYELANSGLSQSEIARELGCNRSSVNRILQNKLLRNDANDIITQQIRPIERSKLGSNNTAYLERKIATIATEKLKEVDSGEKTISRVATELGIKKRKINIQIVPDETGGQIAARLYQKLTDEQLKDLAKSILEFALPEDQLKNLAESILEQLNGEVGQ